MYQIINKTLHLLSPLTLLLVVACNQQEDSTTRGTAETESLNKPTVEVVTPEPRSFTGVAELTGTLYPNQQVKLYAMESGYVQSIHKDIGDRVQEGEIIARLENPELLRKQQRDLAQYKLKKSVYDRLKGIYDKTPDLTTQEQVEIAEAEFESASATLAGTRQQLAFLQLKAPFSGIITKRYVDKGALIQSGVSQAGAQPVVELMETDKLRLQVHIPESDVAAIQEGSKLKILFPELPGQSFETTISRGAGALDPQSKTMLIEVDMDNPEGKLRPGMYARVELEVSSKPDALSVPQPALLAEKNQYFIYVVRDGRAEKIPVRLGVKDKNFIEVLNPDLKPSDRVVVSGKQVISPGQEVEAIQKLNEQKRQ